MTPRLGTGKPLTFLLQCTPKLLAMETILAPYTWVVFLGNILWIKLVAAGAGGGASSTHSKQSGGSNEGCCR